MADDDTTVHSTPTTNDLTAVGYACMRSTPTLGPAVVQLHPQRARGTVAVLDSSLWPTLITQPGVRKVFELVRGKIDGIAKV